MGRSGRSMASVALALIALGAAGGAGVAQESEVEVREIDATRGLALDESQTMRVRIRNDLAPMGSVVVSLVSLTRPEQVLGAVLSNEAREFLIDTRLHPGGFRLVAIGSPAGAQVSRQIDVANQALVKWDLGTGLVRVERLTDEGR